jgi:hypothetical protein
VAFEVVDKGCVIATATYGSELAPEVQFLRGFREGTLYSTFAGSSFMAIFNSFYYSWSPSVAGQISQNPIAKDLTKALIYPLIGILHMSVSVHGMLGFNPELSVIVVGLLAGTLLGAVYIAPISIGVNLVSKRLKKAMSRLGIRWVLPAWIGSFGLILVGEVSQLTLLMSIATATWMLSTVTLSSSAISGFVSRRLLGV